MTSRSSRRRPGPRTSASVLALDGRGAREHPDSLVTEEPLEIRLRDDHGRRTVAITMRTPGSDVELAAGFLHAEGVVARREHISHIRYCTDPGVEQRYNTITVELRPGAHAHLPPLERHFMTTSACGVCGKASLDALDLDGHTPIDSQLAMSLDVLYDLPTRLRAAQAVFARTGGLHAAALFSPDGEPIAIREDVGRHNAVDKLLGWALLGDRLPADDSVLLVSGRTSFEILQKALVARIPVVAGISAPSSLAFDLARRFGVTLIGFLRNQRANVYSHPERIRLPAATEGARS
ncbi:MAG: formate dehydrogenase accessory sulfurtransferase FdhD [Actinobacteria bacterium]|nr:formate dehydrogenase accessory sulfurtransferase FdhD [Actinomycetota bacterium]